jgi:hypothetical protein
MKESGEDYLQRLGQVKDEGTTPLPNGCTLYWNRDKATGARLYFSDEIGGGVEVWNTAIVDEPTLLAAIVQEHTLRIFEYHSKRREVRQVRSGKAFELAKTMSSSGDLQGATWKELGEILCAMEKEEVMKRRLIEEVRSWYSDGGLDSERRL